MFTIVRPIVTQSTHLHLVSFCEADTNILPKNIPLLFIYYAEQGDPVIITDSKLVKGIGKYYQIFASTDPTLGVPPMSNSFLKKYEQDNRDMEEVLLYWEIKDGQWIPFVHPRKGHVIINSLEKAPQVSQMAYLINGEIKPIVEILKSEDKYSVKFMWGTPLIGTSFATIDYADLLQTSKSFHP